MGQYKDEGNSAMALIEEMAEAIQVIAKNYRFYSHWDVVPPGKQSTRWEMIEAEMRDVIYQWERLKNEVERDRAEIEQASREAFAQRVLDNPEDYGLV